MQYLTLLSTGALGLLMDLQLFVIFINISALLFP